MKRIAAIYAIEKEIRGKPADVRLADRQERTRPLVDQLHGWFAETAPRMMAGSATSDAMKMRAEALEWVHALPRRRPDRARQQYRRARHETGSLTKKECVVRGPSTRRRELGGDLLAGRNVQDAGVQTSTPTSPMCSRGSSPAPTLTQSTTCYLTTGSIQTLRKPCSK